MVEVAIAELQGALERREGRLDHPQDGVATRQVVPGDGALGQEPDEPTVDQERPRVEPLGG